MSELDKLEKYLIEKNIKYNRINEKHILGRHQIIVFDENDKRQWDAICQYGSYGFDQGLLEIYGSIVNEKIDGDCVRGWLTADDVIKRIQEQKNE